MVLFGRAEMIGLFDAALSGEDCYANALDQSGTANRAVEHLPWRRAEAAATWGEALFTQILDEFNRIASTNRFGVRVVRSDTKPSPTGRGANVLFEASGGDCKFFNHNGGEEHVSLPTGPGSLHGKTAKIIIPSVNKVGWAFVFLPLNPVAGRTAVGTKVKMEIGLHELLHACGLNTEDPGHEPPGSTVDGDFYDGHAIMFAGDDHVFVGGGVQPNAVGQFFLKPRTVGLVQCVWLLGQF